MIRIPVIHIACIFSILVLFSGCGGGGGDSASTPTFTTGIPSATNRPVGTDPDALSAAVGIEGAARLQGNIPAPFPLSARIVRSKTLYSVSPEARAARKHAKTLADAKLAPQPRIANTSDNYAAAQGTWLISPASGPAAYGGYWVYGQNVYLFMGGSGECGIAFHSTTGQFLANDVKSISGNSLSLSVIGAEEYVRDTNGIAADCANPSEIGESEMPNLTNEEELVISDNTAVFYSININTSIAPTAVFVQFEGANEYFVIPYSALTYQGANRYAFKFYGPTVGTSANVITSQFSGTIIIQAFFGSVSSNTDLLSASHPGFDLVSNWSAPLLVNFFATPAGGSPSEQGAHFYNPLDVAIDSAGNIYVADTLNYAIRKITPSGTIATLAGGNGLGHLDGPGTIAKFWLPTSVTVDASGYVYVGDGSSIRKISPTGAVTTLAGSTDYPPSYGSADGTGSAVLFGDAWNTAVELQMTLFTLGITVDASGNIFVADSGNHTIRKITQAGTVTTIAGLAGHYGSVDGQGAEARFFYPTGITVDASGNLYVADHGNCLIRKITSAGMVSTYAGTPLGCRTTYDATDGTSLAAKFSSPIDLALDNVGNLYVSDYIYGIRKVTPSGTVSTVNEHSGFDIFSAGIEIDSNGNIIIATSGAHVVRKLTPLGGLSTAAGTEEVSGYP